MMKLINLILCFTFIIAPMPVFSYAPEKIQNDSVQIGRGGSVNKSIIFDTGDAGLNKFLGLDGTTKEFSLNSKLNVTGAVSATGAISAGGAISTTSGNISTASGNVSATGSVSGASASFTGSSVHQSGLTMGSGINASKSITVDRAGSDSYLKWNETTGKWVFSNDGSVEKNMGSGSGGDSGINILLNPSWEDGSSVDWVNSGGTYTTLPYGNPPQDDTVHFSFVATTSGQYIESVAHAIPDPVTGGCLGKIQYYTTDSASWKLQVYDNSSNLLSEQALGPKNWQNGYVPFLCPASGTLVKLRLLSLASGTILGDHAHLGSENRTFSNGVLDSDWETCSFSTLAWQGLGTVTSNLQCRRQSQNLRIKGRFVTGTVTGSQVQIPLPTWRGSSLTVATSLPAMEVVGAVLRGQSAVNHYHAIQATGGNSYLTASAATISAANDPSGQAIGSSFVSTVFYLVEAEWTIPIQGWLSNETQTAIRPDAQDWFVDVNIGGANPALLNTASYTEIINASLDLVPNDGSAFAWIPCSTTNPATGLTCAAGSESLGVYINIPEAGRYEVCSEFMASMNNGQNSGFQWVETSNSSQTILQEGKSRGYNGHNIGAGGVNSNISRCGTFRFGSAGFKTLRLMTEGTSTTSSLFLDRAASFGQPDMHVIVRPLNNPFNRPYLSGDQVTTPGATLRPVLFGARSFPECTVTPCSITNRKGTVASSSATRVSAGTYDLALSGLVSSPTCVANELAAANDTYRCRVLESSTTSTNVRISCKNTAGSAVDEAWNVSCIGEK